MNKIGLITIHDTQNYGSLLQTYGLYKMIEELGYDIELIDYENKIISEREKPITYRKTKNIKDFIKKIMWGRAQKDKYENIKKFIRDNMKISNRYTKENISNTNKKYDTFVTGSDIVWGTNITGKDYTYFLDFVNDDKRKISISSSVGTKWEGNEIEKIGKLLSRYEKIAVREELAANWIKELYNINADVTCDPTMLWDRAYWESFVTRKNSKEKYVLIYAVNPDKKNIKDGIEYAKKHNMKAYFINFYTPVKGTKTVRPTTVNEWITLIYNAEVIFSASYHGLLFSLYFEKNVFFYNRGEKSRMISLAKELNIENREGTDFNIEEDIKMNYKEINKKIDSKRKNSISIIEDYLKQ